MRIVANVAWAIYLLDTAGKLHFVPSDGRPGYQVPYLDSEIRSLRRHAAEYRQEGNRYRAKLLTKAAVALEAVAEGLPEAVTA